MLVKQITMRITLTLLFLMALSTAGYSQFNLLVGDQAGSNLTTGNFNVFVGQSAGRRVTTGSQNLIVGFGAGTNITTGRDNTILGIGAGVLAPGSGNVFIGFRAGLREEGSNKLHIANSENLPPLIYGEFDNAFMRVNGDLEITGNITNSAFQSNTTNIASNQAAIEANNAAVLANKTVLDTIAVAISNNAAAITGNTALTNENRLEIESNSTAIGINSRKIANIADTLSTNTSAIANNLNLISNLNNGILLDATNTTVGEGAGNALNTGQQNTYLGVNAGAEGNGSGNVFIGYEAGKNEQGSNQLYIANSATSKPLIKGSFTSQRVVINGDLLVRGRIRQVGLFGKSGNIDPTAEEIERLKQENAEVKAELEEMKAKMEEINTILAALVKDETSNDIELAPALASLKVSPNPFETTVNIKYALPKDTQSAEIIIYDGQGNQVTRFTGLQDKTQVTFRSTGRVSLYICRLIVNGKEVAAERLLSMQ